jgi:TolB protein
MHADGTNVRRVTQDANINSGDTPAWSPDGKRIVFHSPAEKIGHIYVIDVEGTNLSQLTKTDGGALPAWSPDGNKIAFVLIRVGNGELCVMHPDGSNVQRLTHTKGKSIDNSYAAWSPDGERLLLRQIGTEIGRST